MPSSGVLGDHLLFHDFVWMLDGSVPRPVQTALESIESYADYRRQRCLWPVLAASDPKRTFQVAFEQLKRARQLGTNSAEVAREDLTQVSGEEPWLRVARSDVDSIFASRAWDGASSSRWWSEVFLDARTGGPRGGGLSVCHVEAPLALYWDAPSPKAKLEWLRLELVRVGPAEGELLVQLCPSAQTALQVFLGDPDPDRCWWTALDRARDAALSIYRLAAQRGESKFELKGSFVVRWHLKLDLDDADSASYLAGIQGNSHGAAFATAMAKLLAMGHQILVRP